MEKPIINYESLIRITKAISTLRDPEEIVLITVEGVTSILSVPIIIGDNLIGCLRVYTAEPWEFTLNDVNFVQAVAQIVGMGLEMCRVNQGLKDSIDILKTMRDPKTVKSTRRTPYEGVPKSFASAEIPQANA
jgi:transcriptional regulator with GAF, ATPase, and Fis domain